MTATTFRGVPRYLSDTPENLGRENAEYGARVMKMDLLPQTCMVSDVMEAKRDDGKPMYSKVVVQIPRRSSKTTSIQHVLLGRCFNIPDYKVVQTAQSQAIARRVFLDMIYSLEAMYPDEDTRPFVARIGNGQEQIRWNNGSVWWIVAPRSGSFRSQSADVIWLDEAGEYTQEQTLDLIEGVLPLMDTRPQGQIVVSGTPPKTREGMLWKFLCTAREGKPRYGIVDFSMDPTDDPTDEAVWWKVHAGLACGLTDIDIIRERFEDMALISFQREYLCADPSAANLRAIDPDAWEATQVDELLALPTKDFALGFDVHPDGSSAALAAAWYDKDGKPCVQLLEYKAGYSWLVNSIAKILRENRKVPIVFDRVGNNTAVWQELKRKQNLNINSLEVIGAKESAAGVSLLMAAINDQALVHAVDRDLDAAVEGANFRYVGDSRLFGRRTSMEDVSPLVACSSALYWAAGQKKRVAYQPKPVQYK